MTSVKEFRIDSAADADSLGRGAFEFTDRYSVFDWGEMPDHIPGKGASLCTMGAFNFELLEEAGIPHHYRGVEENGDVVCLEQRSDPPTTMAIELTQVPDLPHVDGRYDYERFFEEGADNYLIPLEVVFRNEVPPGSSLRSRKDPRDVGLDRDDWPEGSVTLPDPVVEFSTKYEEQDRYLTEEEADKLAGEADLATLRERALQVNEIVTNRADERGFRHDDGKIECLYAQGTVKVADVVGTFDENRFTVEGHLLSKEFLRDYYRTHDPDWYQAVRESKERSRRENIPDWKGLCEESPQALPGELVELASDLYRAGTNAYTGRGWFDVPELDDVLTRLDRLS